MQPPAGDQQRKGRFGGREPGYYLITTQNRAEPHKPTFGPSYALAACKAKCTSRPPYPLKRPWRLAHEAAGALRPPEYHVHAANVDRQARPRPPWAALRQVVRAGPWRDGAKLRAPCDVGRVKHLLPMARMYGANMAGQTAPLINPCKRIACTKWLPQTFKRLTQVPHLQRSPGLRVCPFGPLAAKPLAGQLVRARPHRVAPHAAVRLVGSRLSAARRGRRSASVSNPPRTYRTRGQASCTQPPKHATPDSQQHTAV